MQPIKPLKHWQISQEPLNKALVLPPTVLDLLLIWQKIRRLRGVLNKSALPTSVLVVPPL